MDPDLGISGGIRSFRRPCNRGCAARRSESAGSAEERPIGARREASSLHVFYEWIDFVDSSQQVGDPMSGSFFDYV